jgi:hypothetical protein
VLKVDSQGANDGRFDLDCLLVAKRENDHLLAHIYASIVGVLAAWTAIHSSKETRRVPALVRW